MQNNIVEPKCKIIKFPDGFECIGHIIFVEGENYDLAFNGPGHKMWTDDKIDKNPNFYNKGMVSGGVLNEKQVGWFGEVAWRIMTGNFLNWEYKKYGDNGDFKFNKLSIDIKTQSKKYSFHKAWVYAVNEEGFSIDLKSDIYVFSFTDPKYQDHKIKKVPICFVGWQPKQFIASRPKELTLKKIGSHKNYYIPYSELGPMNVLLNKIYKNNK